MELIYPDFKKEGRWVKHFTVSKGVYGRTRSYYAWKSLKRRCVEYGTINKFDGFQHFAEFVQCLDYNMEREKNDKFWQIDKDFNLRGDRSYSCENILFLPNEMNSFITNMKQSRDLPLGVCYIDRTSCGKNKGLTKPYRANCKDRVVFGATKYLKYFETPIEAHLAWVEEKKMLLLSKMNKEKLNNHSRFLIFCDYWLSEFDHCIQNKKEFVIHEIQS